MTRAKLERQLIALEKEAVALKGATNTDTDTQPTRAHPKCWYVWLLARPPAIAIVVGGSWRNVCIFVRACGLGSLLPCVNSVCFSWRLWRARWCLLFLEERSGRRAHYETWVARAKYALYAAVVAWHWSSPLLVVPAPSWTFWPLGWCLAWPGHGAGAVGVVAGVAVAQHGAAKLLRVFG